ncbi:hypothetical protein [Methylovulum miyakonense]|uniref:hypothetical protein n=1 Tax=Methylovulum miyakonense TaxID=645578 RepID=UPI0012EB6E1B|nr:hypothetical protein [Methylovulum miyakonense]
MVKKLIFILLWLSSLNLPLVAHATTVDSKLACDKLDGIWESVTGKSWYYNCHVTWSQEVCKSQNNLWFSNTQRCRLVPSKEGQKLLCKADGGTWGKDQSGLEHCFFEKERIQCLAEGGKWLPMGMLKFSGCLHTSRDGGKPCKSSSECEFGCLAARHSTSKTDNALGQCAKTDSKFGCKAYVEEGSPTIAVCTD